MAIITAETSTHGFEIASSSGIGIPSRYFTSIKFELDENPTVLDGIVDAVTDGDNVHSRISRGLWFHKDRVVLAAKTRKILDDQDAVLTRKKPAPNLLQALPQDEHIAGAVPILVEVQLGRREIFLRIGSDDFLLAFDRCTVPVQLNVHPDLGVARNFRCYQNL